MNADQRRTYISILLLQSISPTYAHARALCRGSSHLYGAHARALPWFQQYFYTQFKKMASVINTVNKYKLWSTGNSYVNNFLFILVLDLILIFQNLKSWGFSFPLKVFSPVYALRTEKGLCRISALSFATNWWPAQDCSGSFTVKGKPQVLPSS